MNKVKPKRAYSSQHREKQAESTRNAVLDAAERLFRKNGWSATTIVSIAKEAEISPETIYSRFGNKKTIVHQLVVRAMRGNQQQTPMMQQERRASILEGADGVAIIESFAADIVELLGRVAPIIGVVRSAAETDHEMAELYRALHQSRMSNLRELIKALDRIGALRSGLDPEQALITLWSIVSPELWLLRTDQLAATSDTSREWIRATLERLLLA